VLTTDTSARFGHRLAEVVFGIAAFAGTLFAGAVFLGAASAGEFNRVLSVGDVAPEWKDLPGVDGSLHSWSDHQSASVVVVVFTCNSCPYAVDVQSRLVELQVWLAERKGQLVAINVNKVEDDLLPMMQKRSKEAGFTFPYVFDESQEIAKKFGATTTPEFYVLDQDRKVQYMGALDDSPDGSKVENRFVREAVSSLVLGHSIDRKETVPIGCRIRFDRPRRAK
jgi:peroxiredoxin